MITALKYTFYAYLSDWRDIVLFLTHFKMLFTHPFPSAVFAIFFADSCFPDFLSLSLSVSSQISFLAKSRLFIPFESSGNLVSRWLENDRWVQSNFTSGCIMERALLKVVFTFGWRATYCICTVISIVDVHKRGLKSLLKILSV